MPNAAMPNDGNARMMRPRTDPPAEAITEAPDDCRMLEMPPGGIPSIAASRHYFRRVLFPRAEFRAASRNVIFFALGLPPTVRLT